LNVTLQEFRESISGSSSPIPENLALTGLWWDARGDWAHAHESAQQDEGRAGAWVHAYLHRKEGDISNARYWYGRAGKTPSSATFEAEWEQIAEALLETG